MLRKLYNRFIGLWQTSKHTGQQAIRGVVIVFTTRFFTRGAQIIKSIIIAHLLFPQDLGLFSLATLTMATTSIFFQTGFNSALIQESGDVHQYLDSVWTLNVIKGVGLALLVFFVAAPLGGIFFHNAMVVPLARALAFMILIEGFENIGPVLFARELRFNAQALYEITGFVTQSAVVIVSALVLHSVWALVIGSVAGRAIFTTISYAFHPYRPKFKLDWGKIRHLFSYGKWITLTGIIAFAVNQGDYITIGRLLDSTHLAFYQFAFNLGLLPASELIGGLGGLFFPVFAKLRDDKQRLKTVFVRISSLLYAIIIPASIGLFALAPSIVHYVYGSRWLPILPILPILIVYGFIKAFDFMINPLVLGMGKPHIQTVALGIQSIVMFTLIVPLTHMFGTAGTASAVLAGLVIAESFYIIKVKRAINLGFWTMTRGLYLPALCGGFMYLILVSTTARLPIQNLSMLLAYIGLGVGIYSSFLLALDSFFGKKYQEALSWMKATI